MNPNDTGADRDLFRRCARLHLLWGLVEQTFRIELSYRSDVYEQWRYNVERLGESLEPLVRAFRRAAERGGSNATNLFSEVISYIRSELKAALGEKAESLPADRTFALLTAVRHVRLALRVLTRQVPAPEHGKAFGTPWDEADLRGTFKFGRDLHSSFEAFVSACDTADEQTQSIKSLQLFLDLYWNATFDGCEARQFFEPTVHAHTKLLDQLSPGGPKQCVKQRLESFMRITPANFESTAAQAAATEPNIARQTRSPTVHY